MPVTSPLPVRSRLVSVLAIIAMVVGLVTVVATALVVGASSADALTPPSAVTDVSANSVGSGVLFGGRDEALTVNPSNASIVLAAVELGGVWRSTDAGAHWAHVDGLPLTAMDDVRFAPSDSNLVIATGEQDGVSSTVSAEVYVSTDGGSSWTRAATNSCSGNARSAHKVSFGAGSPGSITVFVATDCGLLKSTDSGSTWTNVNPNGVTGQFWDVKVNGSGPNFTVDTCGPAGFFRSTNGGSSFSQNSGALAGGSVPCRIAYAPGNTQIVLLSSFSATASPQDGLCMGDLQESDNGGTSFTDLNATQDGNCRPADVVTSGSGGWGGTANKFEVFFATDTNWIHEQCDVNNLPGNTACPIGNGNNGGSFSDYDSSIKAVHNGPDSSDLAFNSGGCPFLASGDGGVFSTTNGCTGSPTFAASNVGLHGLQATANAGSSYTGHTDLYYSTQDNGIWNTGDGGSSWAEQGPDVYGVFADQDGPTSQVIYKECCFIIGGVPTSRLFTNNEGMSSQGTLSAPPGNQPAFGNILGSQFGYQSYALVTQTGSTWRIYVTTNNGGAWTQLGAGLPSGSSPSQLVSSGPPATPTFYLLNSTGGARSVTRITGPLNSTATFTAVGTGLSNPSRIAVKPSDPTKLYAEDDGGIPAMKHSTDSGANFTPDTPLTALIKAGGQYSLTNSVTALSMDANSNTVMVGTVDDGIFASSNGGASWAQINGSVQISRSTGFFFDEKTHQAYTASAGRAEWRIAPVTTTTVSSSANPSVHGQSVTLTATVAAASGTPTGNVTLFDGATPIGSGNLSAGTFSVATATLTTGTHPITAVYDGDGNFSNSASPVFNQVVNRDPTTTTVTSSVNPSVFGQPVMLTATVTANPPGSGTPTGTVTFFDGVTNIGSTGLVGGAGTITYTFLLVATHHITAQYSGDSDFLPSTSAIYDQVVNKSPTTTTLTFTPPVPLVNQAVTFTATVHPEFPNPVFPTGTVSFFIDGSATPAATIPLVNGVAVFITTFGGGPHTVVAVYNGDGNYLPSTSAGGMFTVPCDVTITGTHASFTVTSGTTCVLGATITGGISVARGAVLDLENATVSGSVSASYPATFRMCGSHTGTVNVSHATGFVLIGDPTNNCAANNVAGGILAAYNTGGLVIVGNTVSASVLAVGNSGAGPLPGETTPIVSGNHH